MFFRLMSAEGTGCFQEAATFNSYDEASGFFYKGENNIYHYKGYRSFEEVCRGANITGKDMFPLDPSDPAKGYRLRPYMFVDAYGRHMDPRDEDFQTGILRCLDARKKRNPRIWVVSPYYSHPYEFRKDPVPHTGRRPHGRYFRQWKNWASIRRKCLDPEAEGYVRKKAIVPNIWDEEPGKCRERNWKSFGKRRHQWMR